MYFLGSYLYKQGNIERDILSKDSLREKTITDSTKLVEKMEYKNKQAGNLYSYKTDEVYKKYFMRDKVNPWYVVPKYLKDDK